MSSWKWEIRKALPADIEFIYATWIKSFWSDSQCPIGDLGLGTRKTLFCREYQKILDGIFYDRETETYVAHAFQDPHTILGYLVATPPVVHYAFVKEPFRKYGIAKSLHTASKCGPLITHRTLALNPIMKKYSQLEYNPFLLYQRKEPYNG